MGATLSQAPALGLYLSTELRQLAPSLPPATYMAPSSTATPAELRRLSMEAAGVHAFTCRGGPRQSRHQPPCTSTAQTLLQDGGQQDRGAMLRADPLGENSRGSWDTSIKNSSNRKRKEKRKKERLTGRGTRVVRVCFAPGAHTSPRWPDAMSCHNHPRRTGAHLWGVNTPVVCPLCVASPGWALHKTGPVTHRAWPHARIASGCSWQRQTSMFRSEGHSAQHCGRQKCRRP